MVDKSQGKNPDLASKSTKSGGAGNDIRTSRTMKDRAIEENREVTDDERVETLSSYPTVQSPIDPAPLM